MHTSSHQSEALFDARLAQIDPDLLHDDARQETWLRKAAIAFDPRPDATPSERQLIAFGRRLFAQGRSLPSKDGVLPDLGRIGRETGIGHHGFDDERTADVLACQIDALGLARFDRVPETTRFPPIEFADAAPNTGVDDGDDGRGAIKANAHLAKRRGHTLETSGPECISCLAPTGTIILDAKSDDLVEVGAIPVDGELRRRELIGGMTMAAPISSAKSTAGATSRRASRMSSSKENAAPQPLRA